MINSTRKKHNIVILYLTAAAASLFLSLIMLSHRQPIDIDGINLYLPAAKAFLAGNIKAAFHVYSWPFYSFLLAVISKLFHLNFICAANLLNIIFDSATVLLFIALIKELGGNFRTQALGALVILIYPYLNYFRFEIMRGHGYYCFALLSLLLLIRYFRTFKWHYALGWGSAMIIASLFRIEGGVLVCGLPLALLLKPDTNFWQKIHYTLKAYSAHILFLVLLAIALLIVKVGNSHSSTTLALGRLPELLRQMATGIIFAWHNLQHKAALLSSTIFSFTSNVEHAGLVFLIGGIILLLITATIVNTTIFYSLMCIYALKQKTIAWDWPAKAVWLTALLLVIITNFIYMCQELFVSSRYIALLSLLIIMAVPFAAEKIYVCAKNESNHATKCRWLFALMSTAFIYTAIAGIGYWGTSKTYIVDAGKWLQKNSPANSVVLTNDTQFLFYTSRLGLKIKLKDIFHSRLNNYDYIGVKLTQRDKDRQSSIATLIGHKPSIVFSNRGNDKLLIYKIK